MVSRAIKEEVVTDNSSSRDMTMEATATNNRDTIQILEKDPKIRTPRLKNHPITEAGMMTTIATTSSSVITNSNRRVIPAEEATIKVVISKDTTVGTVSSRQTRDTVTGHSRTITIVSNNSSINSSNLIITFANMPKAVSLITSSKMNHLRRSSNNSKITKAFRALTSRQCLCSQRSQMCS